ncbi:hypothetical protein FA743_10290 [Paracoccus gahaiensis]|uniref:Uncharacterized protein n=1 Tax=Paracoccus gahaiensis TaxID=1706839 RepID=A0A4U0RA09_9RHOB|nr:hypothetical protein FA743_10290 [Paracoccus gahaiensis]
MSRWQIPSSATSRSILSYKASTASSGNEKVSRKGQIAVAHEIAARDPEAAHHSMVRMLEKNQSFAPLQ